MCAIANAGIHATRMQPDGKWIVHVKWLYWWRNNAY